MLVTDGGGSIGEAIRVCTRRIEQQQASLDDVRSRIYTPDGQGEWSEDNSENISGRGMLFRRMQLNRLLVRL